MVKKEKRIFIIEWDYHVYKGEYGASHWYHNHKQFIEAESIPLFKEHLERLLTENKRSWKDIKSVRQVTKTRSITGLIKKQIYNKSPP